MYINYKHFINRIHVMYNNNFFFFSVAYDAFNY